MLLFNVISPIVAYLVIAILAMRVVYNEDLEDYPNGLVFGAAVIAIFVSCFLFMFVCVSSWY